MIQKNYKLVTLDINNESLDLLKKFHKLLDKIKNSAEYINAPTVFIQLIFAQIPPEIAGNIADNLRVELPKANIVGMTRTMFALDKDECSLSIDCLFFDEAQVDILESDDCICHYKKTGVAFGEKIAAMKNVKGVLILCAGVTLSLAEFLEDVSMNNANIPFFGAMAGIFARQNLDLKICRNIFSYKESFGSTAILEEQTKLPLNQTPLITDPDPSKTLVQRNGAQDVQFVIGKTVHSVGIVLAVFSGENLHIKTDAIFGWQPLGKEMPVTVTKCKTGVATIDGIPATDIYKKYLGVEADENFLENICEFPLVINRREFDIVRVPPIYDDKGAIYFNGDVKDGETVRLTYGNATEIITNTRTHSEAMRRFCPEAVFLVICGNRDFFLRDKAHHERDAYTRFAPKLSVMNGSAEIFRYRKKGGILNSMLVAIGMREGKISAVKLGEDLPINEHYDKTIPLSTRLANFLDATTRELAESNAELKDMAESAKAASRAKSSFLSSMSHEIRTPINAILGMDEMILRECTDETILEYARNIQTATTNLLGLVNDILDFSKIEAGKMEIIPVEYALSSVLNDLINMISERAAKKGLTFIVEADEKLPSILYGDEIRLKQAVTNILTNAVKYTETGSVTLTCKFTKKDKETILLRFAVKDTGIGIKASDMKNLFAAFTRIEEKRNRTVEGTGLGMSITKQILSLMGSRLEVESVYGEGSTFSFAVEQKVRNWDEMGDFEESYRRMMAGHKAYHEKFTAPKARILVVDDTAMNLTVVKGLLKQTLVKIDTAESGYECLHMVQKNHYDIIFLDHRMPGMDGLETLRHMKKLPHHLNEHTPVISLTANAVSGAREEYMAAGFDDYLTKPINSAQLEMCMIKYLPEEKVTRSLTDGDNAATADETPLPEWLKATPGLNTAEGLKHCGGTTAYLDALTVFANSVSANADEIERYYKKEMWHDYTTKVHALKSTAQVIGAAELSEKARRLEKAGNSGYIDEIKQHTDNLLYLYRGYGQILRPLITPTEDTAATEKPLIDAAELADAYEAMRDMAASFDYDSMMSVFDSLKSYRLPDKQAALVKEIKLAAAKPDWDKVRELLSA